MYAQALATARKPKNRPYVIGALLVLLFFLVTSRRSNSQQQDPKPLLGGVETNIDPRGPVLSGDTEYVDDDDVVDNEAMAKQAAQDDDDELPEECQDPLHFLSQDKQRKHPVALASFPGSGNTWLRFLIEHGSRVYTGSVYQDKALNETYKGEGEVTTRTIAVKTHYPCPNCWTYMRCSSCAATLPVTAEMTGIVKGADAAVFMLRSPFDALLAEFNRIRTGEHAGKLKPEAFTKVPLRKSYETEYDKPTWNQFIQQRLVAYAMAARTYLDRTTTAKSPKDVVPLDPGATSENIAKEEFIAADRFVSKGGKLTKLIFYERLKAAPEKEMKKVFEFFKDIYEAEGLTDSILTPPALAAKCAVAHNAHAQKTNFKWLRNHTEVFNPWKKGQVERVCNVLGKWWFKEVWGECTDGLLQLQRHGNGG